MGKWSCIRILFGTACMLVILGIVPWAYILWWETAHNPEPLSMPLLLKSGEYTSPIFVTDLNDAYQIELDWDRFPNKNFQLDLDWKIVNESGTEIQQGVYREVIGPPINEVRLGIYRPKCGLRQRIILRIHEDVQGIGVNSKLVISNPEIGLNMAEGYIPLAIEWTSAVAGPGVVLFLVLLIIRVIRRNASSGPLPISGSAQESEKCSVSPA